MYHRRLVIVKQCYTNIRWFHVSVYSPFGPRCPAIDDSYNGCPVKETHESTFFFSKLPFTPDNEKQIEPRKTSTKEAYFEYNLQHPFSFPNNTLQGHNRSSKMTLETKGSISKKKEPYVTANTPS